MRWTDRRRRQAPRAGQRTLAALALAALLGCPAAAEQPLSANDWLRGGTAPPPATAWRPAEPTPADAARRRPRGPAPDRRTPPRGAALPAVSVTRLSQGNPDGAGILPAAEAHLPADLWAGAQPTELAAAIAAAQPRLPADRQLLRRLLTVQLDPPATTGGAEEGTLFLARVDRLIAQGWLQDAGALLQAAGSTDRRAFARRFDVAMLAGQQDDACAQMAARPGLAPALPARIYCLAQNGDWAAAALTLRGAAAAGLIAPARVALLERFLDDASADAPEQLPVPGDVTPLDFRLFEAIGQPLPTASLPLPYAQADLDPNSGWKARLDAAERLARAGAADAALLPGVYAEQSPAASGGAWDRARSWQALDAALMQGNTSQVDALLPAAFAQFAEAGLAAPLAEAVVPRLPQALTGQAAEAAARLRLLTGRPGGDPAALPPLESWLTRLLAGEPAQAPAGTPDAQAALARAVVEPPAAPPAGSKGVALLAAMADVEAGTEGDLVRAARGLRAMAALGQADTARAAAVQLLLTPQLGRSTQ